jgi:hypothetical protein
MGKVINYSTSKVGYQRSYLGFTVEYSNHEVATEKM